MEDYQKLFINVRKEKFRKQKLCRNDGMHRNGNTPAI